MIDIQTAFYALFLITGVLMVSSFIIWRQNKEQGNYLYLWPLFFLFGLITFLVFFLGSINKVYSDVIGAVLILAHTYFLRIVLHKTNKVSMNHIFLDSIMGILLILIFHDVLYPLGIDLSRLAVIIGLVFLYVDCGIELIIRYRKQPDGSDILFLISFTPLVLYVIVRVILYFALDLDYLYTSVFLIETPLIFMYIFLHIIVLVAIIFNNDKRLVVELKSKQDALEEKMITIKNMSERDELTDIYNRRYMTTTLQQEAKRHNRYGGDVSLIMFDVDHFKNINDTWGHNVGDYVLQVLCETINRNIRTTDTFARWGGDEFLLLFPNTSKENAAKKADSLRKTVENLKFKFDIRLTVSLGVAEKLQGEMPKTWIQKADKALYQAKEQGRNRVVTIDKKYDLAASISHFHWSPELVSGITIIDEAHKGLVDSLHRMYEVEQDFSERCKALDEILTHTSKHFEEEELEMKKEAFPGLKRHMAIHKILIDNAVNIIMQYKKKKEISIDSVLFVVEDMILEHLIQEDSLFFAYLKKRPESGEIATNQNTEETPA